MGALARYLVIVWKISWWIICCMSVRIICCAGFTARQPGMLLAAGDEGWLPRWRMAIKMVYPWVHAIKESSILATHVLFLFDRTPYSRFV